MNLLAGALVLLAAWLSGAGRADAGHEFPFYPSYYPHEIQIEVVDPSSAATRLQDSSLHAYVGGDPFPGTTAPPSVSHVESLGSYVVVTLNPRAAFFVDRAKRCLAAHAVIDGLPAGPGRYQRHPYPVTPYHADFLQHVDLVESVKRQHPNATSWPGPPLRIRAQGALAGQLVSARVPSGDQNWDAIVETIDVADLWASRATSLNGWLGPPWLKEGWFHAYLLQGGTVTDPAAKQAVEATFQRLVTGSYGGGGERLNLERKLVSLLRGGCERVVAGYTVRREYFNADYSAGVENVAHDALAGLNSAILPRTVKLKDFPWNGWLTVGIPEKPLAAWNPVGGFTDRAGRLIWLTVGDPALFPSPSSGSWVPNRVIPNVASAPRVEIPQDALLPAPGTGLLREVGAGKHATAQVLYRVRASRFHDGTRMTTSDLLYALSFAYRWGDKPPTRDPSVEAATTLIRERLAGFRVLRVESEVLAFGEEKLTYEVPLVEAYVNHRALDPLEVAAVAPPWSSVPWHVLVLMEEAVARGQAAFSREEAERRGVPWLDLVRDQKLKDALALLVEEFGRRGYVPAALRGFLTPDEASERWAALRNFYDAHRHFLVTNGPYRLHQWSEGSTVLKVFRELTYPRGVGAFDSYAIPLRAYITKTERRGDQLTIHAEVEKVERFGREYKIVREPFVRRVSEQDKRSLPVCHHVVVGPDGEVVKAGISPSTDASTFRIDLPESAKPGRYTVLVALTLDGNRVNLPVKVISWTR